MDPIVEMQDITKIYPNGVVANRHVYLDVLPGEVHALIGENGAGKSTLMSILYGENQASSGSIMIRGKEVHFHSPKDAIKAGIGMIHQHFMLVPSFTIAQNIVLGFEPKKKILLDEIEAIKMAETVSNEYGLKLDPRAYVKDVSVGIRQRVEILRLLYRGAEILILDEPTAVLTPQETKVLFESMRQLLDAGKTVILITHKLEEVCMVSDRFTVMRAGEKIVTENTKDFSKEKMAELMVGRKVLWNLDVPPCHRGEKILSVENLSYTDKDKIPRLKNVSFDVHAGEILGIAAVEGNGQTELIEILAGLNKANSGTIKIKGHNCIDLNPRQMRGRGMGHIPEDRSYNGFAAEGSLEENLIADRYREAPFSRKGILNKKDIKRNAKEMIKRFDIRIKDGLQKLGECSGGNIQKAIVARELTAKGDLLIAAQPTRGVDIGASEYIRQQIIQQRSNGKAILLVSADLSEILALSDTIMVLFEGRVTACFSNDQKLTEEFVGQYMLGVKEQIR